MNLLPPLTVLCQEVIGRGVNLDQLRLELRIENPDPGFADLNWPEEQSTSFRYLWFLHLQLHMLVGNNASC